jgi:hypothetical protein
MLLMSFKEDLVGAGGRAEVRGWFYFKGSYQKPLISLGVGSKLNKITFLINYKQPVPH